jgi:hypothetical protein
LACGQNVFGRGDAACIPLFLFAQSSGPPDAPPSAEAEHKARWKAITADGLLSFSYTYNINDPISRLNQFLMFGFNEDDPQLDGGKTGYPAARQRLHDQRSLYELAGSWKVVPQFVLGPMRFMRPKITPPRMGVMPSGKVLRDMRHLRALYSWLRCRCHR